MASYQYIFTMKGLSKVHPPDKTVLKDIWLAFLPGAKIGVLGANGAGKSTLLRIMAGVDKDFAGEAFEALGLAALGLTVVAFAVAFGSAFAIFSWPLASSMQTSLALPDMVLHCSFAAL